MKKTPPYKILGVDPGTNVLGFAVVEVVNKKMKVLELGVIKMGHLETHFLKLKKIFERIETIIEVYQPRDMAVESPFFGKNVQSMLKLGRAQGVAIAAGMVNGLNVEEYSPKKIKQSVTGNGNASKEQVAAMLQATMNVDVSKHYLDSTDALGAAVCHFHQSSSLLGGKKRYNDWSSFISDNPNKVAK